MKHFVSTIRLFDLTNEHHLGELNRKKEEERIAAEEARAQEIKERKAELARKDKRMKLEIIDKLKQERAAVEAKAKVSVEEALRSKSLQKYLAAKLPKLMDGKLNTCLAL